MQEILFGLRQKDNEVTGVKLVIGYLGILTLLVGVIILFPLVILIAFPEEYIYAKGFLISGLSAVALGGAASLFVRKKHKGRLQNHQDALIVTLLWILSALFGALPYVIDHELTFTQAIFESVSMWTTTGMTIPHLNTLPKLFLFHRSVMQFFGGVGLVLVALLFFSDARLSKVFNAEGHADKLLPNFKKTAQVSFIIYLSYAILGAVCYMIAGMNWFEAINYSLCSVATGGGACTDGGITGYNSIAIEIITVFLMLFGSISFFTHLYMVRRKFKNVAKSTENRFYLGYVAVMVLLGALITKNFRLSLFESVSAITSTGFQVTDFIATPFSAYIFLIMIMMLIGAQSGSTTGGIKIHRIYILFNDFWSSLRAKSESPRVVRVNKWHKLGGPAVIDQEQKNECYHFVFLFFMVFIVAALIVSACGYNLSDALFYAASALGNNGLTAGVVPATASAGVLWTGTITMILGRLEIYIVIFALMRLGKNASGLIKK